MGTEKLLRQGSALWSMLDDMANNDPQVSFISIKVNSRIPFCIKLLDDKAYRKFIEKAKADAIQAEKSARLVQPGFAIYAHLSSEKDHKVLINLCQSKALKAPESWSLAETVPIMIGEPRSRRLEQGTYIN
jgi:hypothetical protein